MTILTCLNKQKELHITDARMEGLTQIIEIYAFKIVFIYFLLPLLAKITHSDCLRKLVHTNSLLCVYELRCQCRSFNLCLNFYVYRQMNIDKQIE